MNGSLWRLLITTDFPLAKIARLAEFNYAESMCNLFMKMTGQSPGQYGMDQDPQQGNCDE